MLGNTYFLCQVISQFVVSSSRDKFQFVGDSLKVKMANVYKNNELVDMRLIYVECRQNAAAAARLYTFPLESPPHPIVS